MYPRRIACTSAFMPELLYPRNHFILPGIRFTSSRVDKQTNTALGAPHTDMENAPLLPTHPNPPNSQLYSQRPDWADVTPLEQSDLANPLVPIFYPPDCE